MKIIAGIDYSMSCPSICIHRGNHWHFDNCNFYYFSGSKKLQIKNDKFYGDPIPPYTKTSNESRWDSISNWAIDKIHIADLIGLENYAFGAKGQVFNIGENTGLFKHKMHQLNKNFKVFAPGAIKKFATTKGNADKSKMYEAFVKETWPFDLTKIIECKPDANPISDIVDSYFIAKVTFYESNV